MATPNFDDFKLAVEAVSGGANTVIFDDLGMPSVMVPIPKMKYSDLIKGGSQNTHPAFIVNSVEKNVMYYSKYQNIVINDRAYSLPLRDPRTSVNNDQAMTYCRNKGKGWGLSPHSLWSAIALWTRANGTMPHGNNNFGADSSYPFEKGIECSHEGSGDTYKTNRILTGSGPKTWYHDFTKNGIADLNGNVWEWQAGMRMVNGELQIIPDANIMDSDISHGANSSAWKAIMPDGSLVAPGTSGTLHYTSAGKLATKTDDTTKSYSLPYQSMALDASVSAAPEITKGLLIYPDDPGADYGGDYHWGNLADERVALCGGNWYNGGIAGVFSVHLNHPRSSAPGDIGFRSAYCDL